jgi:hypothetical protein
MCVNVACATAAGALGLAEAAVGWARGVGVAVAHGFKPLCQGSAHSSG